MVCADAPGLHLQPDTGRPSPGHRGSDFEIPIPLPPPVITAVLFFNETITWYKAIGITSAIAAVYFVGYQRSSSGSPIKNTWLLLLPLLTWLGSSLVDLSLYLVDKLSLAPGAGLIFTSALFLSAGVFATMQDTAPDWKVNILDLSAYAGQSFYVAFRHYMVSQSGALFLDAIKLAQPVNTDLTITDCPIAKVISPSVINPVVTICNGGLLPVNSLTMNRKLNNGTGPIYTIKAVYPVPLSYFSKTDFKK